MEKDDSIKSLWEDTDPIAHLAKNSPESVTNAKLSKKSRYNFGTKMV